MILSYALPEHQKYVVTVIVVQSADIRILL